MEFIYKLIVYFGFGILTLVLYMIVLMCYIIKKYDINDSLNFFEYLKDNKNFKCYSLVNTNSKFINKIFNILDIICWPILIYDVGKTINNAIEIYFNDKESWLALLFFTVFYGGIYYEKMLYGLL